MNPHDVNHMFTLRFEKTSSEIRKAASAKITALEAKIEERNQRISKLREEHEIDDSALIQLLTAARKQDRDHNSPYAYTSNAPAAAKSGKMEEKTIGAGVVNFLLTESDFIESEKEAVKRLKTIESNLRPLPRITSSGTKYEDDSFHLSYAELEYLGF